MLHCFVWTLFAVENESCLVFALGFLIHTPQWCYNACIAEGVISPYAVNLSSLFLRPWLSLLCLFISKLRCRNSASGELCSNPMLLKFLSLCISNVNLNENKNWQNRRLKSFFPPIGVSTCIEGEQIEPRSMLNQCCPVLVSKVVNVCIKSLDEGNDTRSQFRHDVLLSILVDPHRLQRQFQQCTVWDQ